MKLRGVGGALLFSVALLMVSAATGAPPSEIINRAELQFFYPVGASNFITSDPVRTVVQMEVGPVLTFRNATFDMPLTASGLDQRLYVQLDAPSCDTSPLVLQTIIVVLRAAKTGDLEIVAAVETAPGSGIFRFLAGCPLRNGNLFPSAQNNGFLEILSGDTVTAQAEGCEAGLVSATIYIDPGGIVFDSQRGLPIAGAHVTLIDASSGLPALVFAFDGITPAPNRVMTGADGRYSFPAVNAGVYRLVVVPPPGYSSPSRVPIIALPAGYIVGDPGSYGGNFPVNLVTGPVRLDLPLDSLPGTAGSGLFAQMLASRQVAEIGDFIDYTVRVKNVSGAPLSAVEISDWLPAGFSYQKKSSRLENLSLADPVAGAGGALNFNIGPLAPDATVTLTYRVRVGPGAQQGDGLNRAQARTDSPSRLRSNVAGVQVRVQGGVFADEGVVLGKVFADANANRLQDAGEPGVPGVRLYLEDGTYAITDGEGKYSFYGLRPRSHVIKLDNTSLPAGARLQELSARNAGSAGTRFIDLKKGELHKADFALAPAAQKVLEEIEQRRKKAAKNGSEVSTIIGNKLTPDGAAPLRVDPRGQPASGVVNGTAAGGPGQWPAASSSPGKTNTTPPIPADTPSPNPKSKSPSGLPLNPKSPSSPTPAMTSSNAPPDLNPKSKSPSGLPLNPKSPSAIASSNAPLDSLNPKSKIQNPKSSSPSFSPLLPPGTLNDANSTLPSDPVAALARARLEQALTNLDNSLGFVGLKDGDVLPAAQANLLVKGPLGARFVVGVNDVEVPETRLGRRVSVADKKLEAWEFIGVELIPGVNKLRLIQYDSFGNARAERRMTVIAPDKLARIKIIFPKQEQFADGHNSARISIHLEDAHGIRVTARTPLTLEASLGRWQVEDLDKSERGTQVFIEGGRAEFALLAPIEPGDSRLVVSSGSLSASATLSFLPELRPMLAVGLIEGQLSLSRLNLNALTPARSRDGFEEELRDFSVNGNAGKLNAGGRVAFFLKGKIKGEYLLTAGFDSEKQTRERLFRDIQPDEFYPVYGDSSVRGFDAQSSGRLYVRIDKRKCYLLYGDLLTSSANEARGLGNYSRSLTGARAHYEKSNIIANVWVSQDSARQRIEELPANGTSGPYYFQTADGIINSEKVEILTRDRNQPALLLKVEPMTRFTDYEFEPFTGRILFKAPVPSLDANLNPIFIRVTYEIDQGGDKFWVYGADAQVKVHERVEVGAAAARDENPQGQYGLYSANATVKLAPKTFLLGEVAHSDAGGVMDGQAYRVDLRHSSEKVEARAHYGRADQTFSNSASILTGGRVEAGVKAAVRVAPNTRLVGQAIHTESLDNQGNRKGVYGGVEHTFPNQVKAEVGARRSTESAAPASSSTVGVVPNDVTSVRAKVTTPVPRVKGASVYGEYETDVTESGKVLAAFGGEYQFRQKTRFYARHEFINSLGGPFELNTAQQRNATVFGLDSTYMKDGSVFNEYRARDALSGREAETAVGLRNLWELAEGLRLHTTFERITPIQGGDQNESTAGTAAIEYSRNPDAKATARIEVRSSTPNNSLLNTLGYARKMSRDWTVLGRTIIYLVEDNGPAGNNKVQARFQGGVAYRQTETDRWNALGKYEFKLEEGDALYNARQHRKVNILSLHVNYQPTANWLLSGHYAGKLAFEETGGRDEIYDAHLLSFRVTYDITKRLDLGVNLAALFNGDLRSIQYAVGPEVGFTIRRNLRLGLGYNFTGFRDRDLTAEDYTQLGIYLALRFKFDEELLGFGSK